MKKLAIIMVALIAVNLSVMCSGVVAKAKVKSTKIVQSVKYKKKSIRKRKRINCGKIKRKLISYGKRKGMMFEKKLTVKSSSWLPPITIKHYDKRLELTKAGKDAVDDLLFYWDKYEPSDIAFNIIMSKKYLYIVYG